jgi:hypothetical protein
MAIFVPAFNAGVVSEEAELGTLSTVTNYLFYPLLGT